jgi:dTDP-4-amino-4,6-dideoxygalactose transaminase
MNIPFVDLNAQYDSIKEDIDASINAVISEKSFIGGKYVGNFEQSFAQMMGVKHCVPVGNGTDALFIAMKMLGIGLGDEVITTALSWISTSESISQTGAKPIFIDINEQYYTIDEEMIEKKITSATKAILPVHIYGQPTNMTVIKNLCDKHGLFLIEDCAQAHFAEWREQKVGTFGNAGTFSFFPSKNLGAYGDAGAIVTNDDDYAIKCRMYANHGALIRHHHKFEGLNSRLDGLQAAILSAKLPHILEWNQKRRDNANIYNQLLDGLSEVSLPIVHPDALHVFHLYVIKVKNREDLGKYLKNKGIATGIHYPTPLPFLEAYDYLEEDEADYPVAVSNQKEILSLPMYPELEFRQIEYICDEIKGFYS